MCRVELFLSKISGGGEVSGIPRGDMFVDTAAAGGGVDIIHLLSSSMIHLGWRQQQ